MTGAREAGDGPLPDLLAQVAGRLDHRVAPQPEDQPDQPGLVAVADARPQPAAVELIELVVAYARPPISSLRPTRPG
jgi:hypothetical protein